MTADQALHDIWFMDIEHDLDDFSHSLDVISPINFLNTSIIAGTGSCLSPQERKRRGSEQPQNNSTEMRELKQIWEEDEEMAVFGGLKRVESREFSTDDL